MMSIRERFNAALRDTVEEWKRKDNVKGIFVFGSYITGTLTVNSDLDIGIVWDAQDAPVPLLAEHGGVRIDMHFLTPRSITDVVEGSCTDEGRISEVIGQLRAAEILYDRDGDLKKWREQAGRYVWPAEVIRNVKARALAMLDGAEEFAMSDDMVAAVHESRRGMFELGKAILMMNNIFKTVRPAEILSEVRLLDPIAYSLFLRAFKLKGLGEEELLEILADIEHWLGQTEERIGELECDEQTLQMFNQAQKDYHGAMNLTYAGDYELAVLEMRRATNSIGKTLLRAGGTVIEEGRFVPQLREHEPEYYKNVFVRYGAFEIQPKGVQRNIGEARFIAQRL